MPGKRTIEVSDRVYEKLQTLVKRLNAGSENAALEKLLDLFNNQQAHALQLHSTPLLGERGVAATPVKVVKRDHFWVDIVVGKEPDVEYIALNNIQYEKLCKTRLLPSPLCLK
jgi:hypothetical protein